MKLSSFSSRSKNWVLSVLLPLFALNGGSVQANPTGADVVQGNVVMHGLNTSQLNIVNNSTRAIINWQSFSINKGESTTIHQAANAFTLNRVTGGNPTAIYGQLKAVNGGVAVINTNGILVSSSGVIDVGGRVVLSTLNIDDKDFMKGGQMRFHGASNAGVTNFGTISSSNGDVVIMGGFVDNQGQIGALNGNVAIGTGGDILLDEAAGAQISVKAGSDYQGTGINNQGTIQGASVDLKAHGNVYALAINNGGAIRATGADRSSGRVLLRASGGSSNINLGANSSIQARAGADGGQVTVDAGQGNVNVAGQVAATGEGQGGHIAILGNQITQEQSASIDASGKQLGGTISVDAADTASVVGRIAADSSEGVGGDVAVTADTVIIDDGAHISADGYAAGGRLRIGGDYQGRDTGLREATSTFVNDGSLLTADSVMGDGGLIIVWSNVDTLYRGELSASALNGTGNGGFAEISGERFLDFDGTVRVGTIGGKAGTVLFDPGDVYIGASGSAAPPLASPNTDSFISIAAINSTLQSGANVLIVTEDGNITFEYIAGGGDATSGVTGNDRNAAIQWTNSQSSFGAFAGRSIFVNNHIRTSGAGSISLLAGWTGTEADPATMLSPQDAWDYYVSNGKFGSKGGSVFLGSASMTTHIEVGSRFGDTNVAGTNIILRSPDTDSVNRSVTLGFKDNGNVFAIRNTNFGGLKLTNTSTGERYLSDGQNSTIPSQTYINGMGDPIVAVVGNAYGQEKDMNGDGIPDGVMGINSTGLLTDTFIPYSNHYNSDTGGNWWWQQIDAKDPDPLGLGSLRPENGAGTASQGANINVLATGTVTMQVGSGQYSDNAVQIGHGGSNRGSWGSSTNSSRATGSSALEQSQMERIWGFNGTASDRTGTSIARLAPVYGNINVFAGVVASKGVTIDHAAGTVDATVGGGASINLVGLQEFKTSNPSSNSYVAIGHGGIGQFGQYYGDINVQAGGDINLLAGEGTRASASIGHITNGHAYWNVTTVVDQQLRLFATVSDFDNPNLNRGELFSGNLTTQFDPNNDPGALRRVTLADYTIVNTGGVYSVTYVPGSGNYIPVINTSTGAILSWKNVNNSDTRTLAQHPAWYSDGLSTSAPTATAQYGFAPLTLSPVGTIVIPALDGSVVNGLHGDITVKAGGDLNIVAYTTEGVAITGSTSYARDSRWAGIGHGGRNFDISVEGAGYDGSNPGATKGLPGSRGQSYLNYWVTTGDEFKSGARSDMGPVGSVDYTRSLVFNTITGDIDVTVGKDMNVLAGNDIYDYAQVGHGGAFVADYESSSFILGDIRVRVGGDLLVRGGVVSNDVRGPQSTTNTSDRDIIMRAWAMIGHGGYRHGFLGLFGDIDVEAGGNIHVQGGAYNYTEAKIGHDSAEGHAQVGGEFNRLENFQRDFASTDILSVITPDSAYVKHTNHTNGSVVGDFDFTASGAGTLVNENRASADIRVVAGGDIRVDLAPIGERYSDERRENFDISRFPTANMDAWMILSDEARGVRTQNNYAMIGHGGIATQTIYTNNTATNYGNKIGNITVESLGGDVILENGTGEQRWARIGHAIGASNRQTEDSSNFGYARAIHMIGDITVKAAGDVTLNARAADENDIEANFNSNFGSPNASRLNPVVIGHGGIWNNIDVVVLSNGEIVNGVKASSNITVEAGGDVNILAGLGVEASYAQIGHGFASDAGNDASRLLGIPTGFAGDISVYSGGTIRMEGSPNAWTELPSGLTDKEGRSVHGAFAAIGHGGYMLDAPSSGDIFIYAEKDLIMTAQERTDEFTKTAAGSYALANPTTMSDPSKEGGLASAYNFVKIGHIGVENNSVSPTTAGQVLSVTQSGDITVIVGRDLTMKGGTTPNVDLQPIYGAFAQIGHGGPSVTGEGLTGDITVLVKNNLTMTKGTEITDNPAWETRGHLNNFVMIGHGDKLNPNTPLSPYSPFRQHTAEVRTGDITVAVGKDATLTGAMIGHLDPATTHRDTNGDVRVAVSRLDPFYGGEGILVAQDDTVFASGRRGMDLMQIFIPTRSNNKMDNTTRINEKTATFATAPGNFTAPFNAALGQLAGRADEVYLTPDLWWDETDRSAKLKNDDGGLFPLDAFSGQGGAIALVNNPGGFWNMFSQIPGSLGDSATLYRGGNGISGAGNYTIYYDAIRKIVAPIIPPGPIIWTPFDPIFFQSPQDYDFFFLGKELYGEIGGVGTGLYGLLGLFERDEVTQELTEPNRLEAYLDKNLGSRRDLNSFEEQEEEDLRRRRRGNIEGQVGMSYYIYEPATNRYSSYRIFGNQVTEFYPVN